MKEIKLLAIQPKSFRPRTTLSRHTLGYSPNLLRDEPMPTTVNLVWVADITYIPLKTSRFAYLALIMDLYSRRIIAWNLQEHLQEALPLDALKAAIKRRQPAIGLLHHSDRGGQYAAKRYRAVLERAQARQSMSRPDDCYDNAFMESCFGTCKTELEIKDFDNIPLARKEIKQYIGYYNVQRRHSALEYLTPCEFEKR